MGAFTGLAAGIKSKGVAMVERRSELNRRYHRKNKMGKLKAKLARAKDAREREQILKKIHVLSPWWSEPAAARG
jgi:hypothetical protein